MAPTHPHLRHLQVLLTEAIIRVCEHQAPFVQKLKIEGTLCVTADSDNFIVTQITETLVKTRRDPAISAESETDREGGKRPAGMVDLENLEVKHSQYVNSAPIGGPKHNRSYCEGDEFFVNYAAYGLEPGEIPKTKEQLLSQLMNQRALPQPRQYTPADLQLREEPDKHSDPRVPSSQVTKEPLYERDQINASNYKELKEQLSDPRTHAGGTGVMSSRIGVIASQPEPYRRHVDCWNPAQGATDVLTTANENNGDKRRSEGPPPPPPCVRGPEIGLVSRDGAGSPEPKRRRASSDSAVLEGFGDSFSHIIKSEPTSAYYSESIDRAVLSYNYPHMGQLHTMEFRAEEMLSQARRGTKHTPAQTYFNELLRMCASKAGIWKEGPKLRDVRPDQKDRFFLLVCCNILSTILFQ